MKEKLYEFLVSAGFATGGGVANMLVNMKDGEKINVIKTVAEVFIAIFAGIIVHCLANCMMWDENVKIISVSVAGYSARAVLAVISVLFIDKLKMFLKIYTTKEGKEK